MDCARWELEELIIQLRLVLLSTRLKGADTRSDAPTLDERIRNVAYTTACETLITLIDQLDEFVAQHIDEIED
jgi:hypothetical protein